MNLRTVPHPAAARPPPPPALFLTLYLPFGIASGYFTVTLGYQLAQAGVSTASIAVMASILAWLQVGKIAWAPVADSVLTYRGLYALACLAVTGSLACTGLVPVTAAAMPVFCALAVLIGAGIGLIGVTTNALMARVCLASQRGRAAGWSAAGNLGGVGLGGGLGLWIATNSALPWLAAAILAAICSASLISLRFISEPPHEHREPHVLRTLGNVGVEIWRLARSRPGAMAILIMLLPLGTGSAANLFSAIAGDWHASADMVALVTGAFSGVLAGLGALAGGFVCDRMDRKGAYLLAGLVMAACTLIMMILPKMPVAFVIMTLAYNAIGGFTYAASYAVMLDAGASRAAATKCDLVISLSNIPIAGMTMIDGAAQTRFGSDGMLLTETVLGVVAVAVYVAVVAATRRGVATVAVT